MGILPMIPDRRQDAHEDTWFHSQRNTARIFSHNPLLGNCLTLISSPTDCLAVYEEWDGNHREMDGVFRFVGYRRGEQPEAPEQI